MKKEDTFPRIYAEELKQTLSGRQVFALMDVRELAEYEREQIPGAGNVPRRELETRVPRFIANRKTKLILYSNYEKRALLAAFTLRELGYRNIAVLGGGLTAWKKAKYETFSGIHVTSKIFGEFVSEIYHEVHPVKPDELKAMQADGNCQVLEVRPAEEARITGSIPGALNYPGVEVIFPAADFLKSGKDIVVSCAGRTRGIIAAATLQALGYDRTRNDRVRNLEGGTLGWQLAGNELEEISSESPEPSDFSISEAENAAKHLAETNHLEYIECEKLKQLLSDDGSDVLAVDTRQMDDFRKEHIPGTISYPGGQAVQNTDVVALVHHAAIIFVDDREARSIIAAYWYKRMRIPNVLILRGGIEAWKKAGYATESGDTQGRNLPSFFAGDVPFAESREAAEETSRGRIVLDVDDGRGFAAGHLPDAVWIPRGRLEERIGKAVPDREAAILVTAADVREAVWACRVLIDTGYKNAKYLKGGKAAWKTAGGELAMGSGGQRLDDWQVRLTEYDDEEAARYFEWEKSLTEEEKYLAVFQK